MRVLFAVGPFAGLSSARTGAALARAWAERGAQCAVLPIGEAGQGFGEAWRDLVGDRPGMAHLRVSVDSDPDADEGSSREVGMALARLLVERPGVREIWLEVDGHAWHDGGAGMLHALGAVADRPLDEGVAALAGVAGVDLAAPRRLLAGARLHLVTDSAQRALQLTGLRGITAVRGHARGDHPGTMLAVDQALADLAAACDGAPGATVPGSGALGGLGFAVGLLGGDVSTGPAECARIGQLAGSAARAHLVVTGYDELHFGTKGGDLVGEVVDAAREALRPVVALARQNWISSRELRTMGIEEAYSLTPEGPTDEEALTEAARRVASTWCW